MPVELEVTGTKVELEPITAQTFSLTVPSAVPAVVTALATGPQGPTGATGPQGPQGPQGDPGVVQADAPITYDGPSQTVGIDASAYVASVNGSVGTVVLDAAAVGAVGTATGLWVYDYGTAIPSVRPVAAAVYWRGTAEPGTAIAVNGDLWYDSTGD